jgi:1-acyl-sn-glycerol-3-phosphate acyltransferase
LENGSRVLIEAWVSSRTVAPASSRKVGEWLYPALNVAQALFLGFWSLLWISAALIVAIVAGQDPALAMARRIWAPGMRWAAGADLRVEAEPTIDWSRPYVVVMNHQSMLDIVMAFIAVPANLRFVAKDVLKYVPFLGWYMWATGMIFVKRGSGASLLSVAPRVAGGASVLIYPEGTRSTDGRIGPFKKGAFALATAAHVPIVPVAIDGSGACLPRDGFRARPGVIRVKIGCPIPTNGPGAQDVAALGNEVRDALIALHVSIGGSGGAPAPAPRRWGLESPPVGATPAGVRPSRSRRVRDA